MPTGTAGAAHPAPITVALIEDNRLVREGLTALINQQVGLQVISGESSEGGRGAVGAEPHVVLLDIGLRHGDSLRIARKTRVDYPGAKVS